MMKDDTMMGERNFSVIKLENEHGNVLEKRTMDAGFRILCVLVSIVKRT